MSDYPLRPVVIQYGRSPRYLDMAEAHARQQYVEGHIEAEDLEAELERLWLKREERQRGRL